ncbi:MAG TPA: hypothetical protein DCL18_00330 [Prevotella sp.]|nr:hypothetical protein [Prevotella sp.]
MLSAKKLTEGVTIMCIFLISARIGGLATPSEGPGATVGARARGKETAYTLLIYMTEDSIVVAITPGLTRV